MVEISLTVGKLDASLALLLTKDHHLIEFPTILLPNGVRAGSIIKITCDEDFDSEKEEAEKFDKIQQEILSTFATNLPQAPNLKIKNVTQTSCVLEWDKLNLGTSNLKSLILFKDGKKLGLIPQPLTNRTSKLSGLPIDKSFKVQLHTTAGTFLSNEIEVTTHKMTDLTGITVCLGDLTPNDQFTKDDIEEALKNMGAKHPAQTQVKVDTTHFLCTRENKQNPEYVKANDMNIPIIRPEWLKACEKERRIVGVRDFYVKECVLPDLFAKNYWGNTNNSRGAVAATSETASSQQESEQPPVPSKEDVTPVTEETAKDEPVTEEPVKEEPVTEEPVKEELTEEPTEEPAVEQPEEPVKEEPTEEPAEEEPTEQLETKEEDIANLSKAEEATLNEPEQESQETAVEATAEEVVPEVNETQSNTEDITEEIAVPEKAHESEIADTQETKEAIDDAFDSVPLEEEKLDDIKDSPAIQKDSETGDLGETKDLETVDLNEPTGDLSETKEEATKEEDGEEENGEDDEEAEDEGEEDGDEDGAKEQETPSTPTTNGTNGKKKKNKKKKGNKKK
ncbi:LOW QUALITY PROTEIN: CHS5 Chitin biosynthesis protein CHS5 [Candida maltosa Xu316]